MWVITLTRPLASTLNESDWDNDFSLASKLRLFKTVSRSSTTDLFWRQKTRITAHALFLQAPSCQSHPHEQCLKWTTSPDQVRLMSEVTGWGRQATRGAWAPEPQRPLKKMNWNGSGWKKHESSFLRPSNVSGILWNQYFFTDVWRWTTETCPQQIKVLVRNAY